MKILVVGPSWVGDTIMAQTLFKTLKLHYNAVIDVLAPEWSHPVLERMVEVNKALVMPFGHGEFGFKKRYGLGKMLRSNNYDWAIVLPNSWKSALVPFFAKIPVRTGWLGEMRWGLLNDIHYLDKLKYPKMVQRYIQLAKNNNQGINISEDINNPILKIDQENKNKTLKKLSLNLDTKVLAICAGAAYGPSKCWPKEYFAEVINAKLLSGWQIWLFGSKSDKSVTDAILNIVNPSPDIKSKIKNLAGELDLLETIDLLSTVNTVIANDSGLMHIAASLGKPIIAIYGSTTPNFTPPLTDKSVILEPGYLKCRPCFKRACKYGHYDCMTQTKPKMVLQSLESFNEYE